MSSSSEQVEATGAAPAAAVDAVGLGKRYRRGFGAPRWALRDCTVRIPVGSVCALVGPNGAGKSTLLALASGLLAPSEGRLRVLGEPAGSTALLPRIGYLDQIKPLHARFTIREMLGYGAELNPAWDDELARSIVAEGGLDPWARISALSGGQRTRVAFAVTLAKRPELLLLDEPMADLDPLSRHQLMGRLLGEAAEHGTTVVISSHVLSELDRACDHLALIDRGRIRLSGSIDEILDSHRLATGPSANAGRVLDDHLIVERRMVGRQTTALLRRAAGRPLPEDGWTVEAPDLEQLLLAYLRSPQAPEAVIA
ncbi:ABC transporter ATP-binding protein [Phaeacidiphilus oryzae]|uniref:ABC transporter ATP-binding protein n=1 Tax=Phaeacidiphilus oryzae TaxID=348818 RepID=UPI00068E21D7|nr:ABC transporter ATP-binding protein [Phaeacidiphilus oryzae]